MKRCWTCGEDRDLSEFASNCARRCQTCLEARLRAARCRACGEFSGMRSDGEPRAYCDAKACQDAQRSAAVAVAVKARQRKLARTKTRLCPACKTRKPRTVENFSPTARNADGTVARLDYYCRPCKAADQSARYHGDEQRRVSTLARAKRQRERINARRRADPEFDRAFRARSAELDRARRRRVREGLEHPRNLVPKAVDHETGGMLPAAPLAAAVRRYMAGILNGSREDAAKACGVDVRTIFGWLEGEYEWVSLDVADAAVIGLDLLWFDVWPPGEYPKAQRLFEGECVAS